MNERLTRSDWIQHGLRTLAAEGAGALKVGPMASGLGVSRGSFYWHFEDVAAFRAELLQAWREQATDRVIRRLSERTTPDRLNYLLKGAFSEDRTLDRAVRSWAAEDAEAAAVVTSVDASRVAYIAKLLTEAGVDAGKALPRANFVYWAYLGQAAVMDPRHATIDPSAIDDIGDLFEA
ncbi:MULTISPECIES: TetR/AcrR family transcriptional regulator [unclassified Phenylobacterium]|uniref:TetR/AcrR family transcriptional regulator n=1 Tax=unclassified Phenylobacterium TaxID=2640670 RepID=UPI00083AE7F0|nr:MULTISPECIES: TetR/AcrR family transcriptional regulator [unclassified Phenylobacterium]